MSGRIGSSELGIRSASRKTSSEKSSKTSPKRRSGIYLLEPRVMYDGAGAASAHHHHHDDTGHTWANTLAQTPPATETHTTNGAGSNSGRSHADWATDVANANQIGLRPGDQVVFVDSQITNYQSIVAAINPGVRVIVYDGTQDGLAEIAEDLQGVHGLASIDIISPGGLDAVQVGTDTLTTSTISQYSADLAAIGNALSRHGQLDLYGGDVTGSGDGFLTALQQATGRNVAASTDPIGATALGGTWTLDASTGPTPHALPADMSAIQSFDELLASPNGLGPGDQVVFVDSQISDYQAIVAAINPGVKVFVYDGTQDGLAQIAQDLLGAYDLASVDIISHGAADEVLVGTDVLTTSTIPTYAADLTAIGNALAPNGQLDLYGCDVAAAGDGFLTALQQATGRNVAASTDPIGATLLGGTWTLDATTGPTPDALPANLAELQAFDGLLLSTPAQIYFDTYNGDGGGVIGQGNMVEQVSANGSTLVSSNTIINDGSPINPSGPDADPYPALTDTTGFVVDTALNEYFIASYNAVNYTWTIQEGSLSGGGLTTIYTDPFPSLTANDTPAGQPITGTAVVLGGLAVDSATGELYFSQSAQNYQTGDYVPADTGIYEISVKGGTPTLVAGGTTANLSNPLYMVLDTADNLLFFDDSIGAYPPTFPAVDNLDVANLTTGAVTVLKSFTSSDPDYFTLQGLAIDTANSTLYLTAVDYNTSSDNAIYSIPFSVSGSGSTATASIGTVTTLYSGAGAFQPTDIVVDAQAGIFYTTGTSPYYSTVDSQYGNEAGVFEGSLSGGSTLTEVFAVSSVLPTPTESTGDAILDTYTPQLFLADIAPVVTAGATATFDGGGSAVTLDSGLAIEAGSSATLASATVTLSSGALSTDVLSFHNGTNTETFSDGDTISATYSAGVLSLSGTATVADYQTALDQVQFSTTSHADPTNGGSDTTRTVSWVVNDGTSDSTAVTSTLDTVHVAPTITAGATVTDVSGGSAVVLDSALAATDVDSGGDLIGATVSIVSPLTGDTLSFTNQNGISGSYASGVLTLTGTASVADYQAALESIAFSTTSTTAGNRTIDWSVKDGSTSNGTSATATSTVDVLAGPVVTAGATATFDGGGSPVLLDSRLTVTDAASTTLASATVSISTGFQSGDVLSFNGGTNTETFGDGDTISATYSGHTLTLTGAASVADYQTALDSITYSFSPTNGDPTNGGGDTSRTISWVASDGVASNTPATSTLDTVHVEPTVTAGASVVFEIGSATPVPIDSALTVTDVDSGGDLTGATVSIVSPLTGDTLSFIAQNGITESSFTNGVLTLAGTASVADYEAALESITFSTTSTTAGDRTIDWSVKDGSTSNGTSATATSTVDVLAGPVVTAGGSATFDGGGTAVTLDSGLTVTDALSTTLTGATVSVGTGYVSGDTLNFTNQNGISEVSYTGGVLTLTGTASVADYQAALESVTYSFSPSSGDPTSGGGDTSRTISWVVNDGVASNTAVTSTLSVVHEPPTVTAGASVVFEIGSATPVPIDSALTVTDVDSGGDLTGATVSIVSPLTGDTLSFTNQNGISGSYNSSTGVLTLSGTASVADYQAALQSVDFSATATSPGTRTIDWSVNDGSSSNGSNTPAATSTINLETGPVVTAGATATFDGGGAAVTLDSGLTVTDALSTTLTSATVSVGTGYISGDVLSFNGGTNTETFVDGDTISATYSGHALTLTGTASVADYQTALDSVTYSFSPANGDPTNGAAADTSRTISWVVNDGVASNMAATSALDVVHEPPTVTAGASVIFEISSTTPILVDSALTVTDVDSGGDLTGATVSIGTGYASGDTLSFTNQDGISGAYNSSTGVLTLSGTASIADYQAALESITFSTTATSPGTRTLDWTVNDGSSSNGSNTPAATSTVNLETGPVVTAGATATFDGGGSSVLLDSGLTVTDAANGTLTGATVSVGTGYVSGDTLNFTAQNGISEVSYTAGVLTLTGTASVADYQTALDSITYSFSPTNGDPTNGGSDTSRAISWVVGDGVVNSPAASSTLDVVHEAPVVTAGGTATFDGGGAAVALDSTITLSDPDSGGNLTGATVTISSGLLSGDNLNFTAQNGISEVSYTGGVLTLTGTASVADYQAALQSITYSFSPSDADPTLGGTDTSRTISWQVSDGSTSNGASNSPTTTLDVVHEPPTVTAGATAIFVTRAPTAVPLDSTLTVTDPDSGDTLTGATVSIASGYVSGDVLSFNGGTNTETFVDGDTISATYSGHALTLTGTASVADYQTALDSITFDSTVMTAGTRTIDWVASDSISSSAQATSTVNVVTGPTVTAGGSATFDGGGSPVPLDGTLTLTDQASPTLASATVSISSGFLPGDVLSFNGGTNTETFSDGDTISATYSGHTLTLTGTAKVADYQAALDSITYSFSPANGDPTGGGTDTARTVSWTINDGTYTSTSATSTLHTVHERPTVTAGATQTFDGGGAPVVLDGALTVSDPDSGGTLAGATVSISTGFQSGDVLSFNGGTNTETFSDGDTISATYSGHTLTLTGAASVADYQSALRQVEFGFTGNANPTGFGLDTTRTIDWQVTDGSTSNGTSRAVTSTLDVVHTPPTLTPSGVTETFDGGGPAVVIDPGITVTDPDSSGSLVGAVVGIVGGAQPNDVLSFNNGTDKETFADGATISAIYSHGFLVLIGKASVADYQTALEQVEFGFTGNTDPTVGGSDTTRTIDWVVDDGSLTHGLSAIETSTLDVVHTPPVVLAGGTVTFDAATGNAVPLDSTLTVTDVDSGGDLTGATATISAGLLPGDVLSANTAGTAITATYSNGVLTLSGTDTIANYTRVLDSVTFASTGPNPTSDGADLTRTISWSVTDGSGSNGTNVPAATSDVIIKPQPIVEAGGTVSYIAGPGSVVADPTIIVYDGVDITGATVSITNGFLPDDTLTANTAGTSIHASYNAANGVLTLTGADSIADYQKVLATVSYSSSDRAQSSTLTLAWQVTDQNSRTSAPATTYIDVTASLAPAPGDHVNPGYFGGPTYESQSGGSSPMVTDVGFVGGPSVFGPFSGGGIGFTGTVYSLHADIDVTMTADGRVDFNLPLGAVEASLGGDIVTITATLPDGQPLPPWLHFNIANGQLNLADANFVGQVPDEMMTGAIGPNGGLGAGDVIHSGGALAGIVLPTVNIQIVAHDSRGNTVVFVINVNVSGPAAKHGSLEAPHGRNWDFGQLDLHQLPHDIGLAHWNQMIGRGIRTFTADKADAAHLGRPGLSAQLDSHGWRGMHSQRTALLDSLQSLAR